MSELRANILVFLTRENGHSGEVPLQRFYDEFPHQFRCEQTAVDGALADLRKIGLIEMNAGGITLSHLSRRKKVRSDLNPNSY